MWENIRGWLKMKMPEANELGETVPAAQTSTVDATNDGPIEDPSQDCYGLDSFSKAVAGAIRRNDNPDGWVLALNGEWGTGKSSTVNLALRHLKDLTDSKALTVVRFSSWWFRGEEALTLAFFRELYAGIAPTLGEQAKKLVPKLGARLLQNAGTLGKGADAVGAHGAGTAIGSMLQWLGTLIEVDEGVEKTHGRLAKALSEREGRFLVVIDDIDRLAPDEALLMFRLVKSAGRLPKVAYLLVFDRLLAERIASEQFPSEGAHYLDKIIQTGFELPLPLHSDLLQQVLHFLGHLMEGEEMGDGVEFANLFYDVVAPEIRVPRDVVRLRNALTHTWPVVKGEVNMADFVAVEALRLSRPELHRAIRDQKENLCGTQNDVMHNQGEHAAFLERVLLGSVPQDLRARYKRSLQRLFPRLESVWSNVLHTETREWARQRRICSKAHFDAYFWLAPGQEVLPKSEMDELVARAADPAWVAETLLVARRTKRKKGTTRASLLLDELALRADEVHREDVNALVRTLFEVADALDAPEDAVWSRGFDGNFRRLLWVVQRLTLDRFAVAERSALLTEACHGAALGWLTYFVEFVYGQHHRAADARPVAEADRLVDEATADALLTLALARVREGARSGELADVPDLAAVLYRWRWWSKDEGEEVRAWTGTLLANDANVLKLVRTFTSFSTSQGFGDHVGRRRVHLSKPAIAAVVDAERLVLLAEEALPRLPEAEAHDIRAFVAAWRAEGRED